MTPRTMARPMILFTLLVGGAMALAGVAWTIGALPIGAPWFFAVFGLVFVVVAAGG